MAASSVVWAESPDEDPEETADAVAPGEVDNSLAVRRLSRWLKGMFGGTPPRAAEDDPGRTREEDG